MDKDSDMFDDNEITFLMSSSIKKVELWNKANKMTSRRYWKIIECNKDLYKDILESESNDIDKSYNRSNKEGNVLSERSSKNKVKIDDENSCPSSYVQNKIMKISQSYNRDSSDNSEDDIIYEINHYNIPDLYVPEILKILWSKTTNYEKMYYLWTECFTIYQMNALWNSLEFPFEYFKQIKLEKNIAKDLKDQIELIETEETIYNYKNMMALMKNKDLDNFLSLVLWGKDKNEENTVINYNEEYFCNLMKERSAVNDLKSPLWIVLPLKQKILMCVSQYNQLEFKIMTLLLFLEIKVNIKKIKQIDKEIEGTVTNLIFELFLKISEEKALIAKQFLIDNRNKIHTVESKEIIEYLEFMGNTFEKMNKYKHRIINEVSYQVTSNPFNRESFRKSKLK